MSEHGTGNSLSELARAQMKDLRLRLLQLHKALLDAQRASYERAHGRVASTGEVLRLVMHDEHFAWLRVLSGLIVRMDEMLDQKTPVTERDAEALWQEARSLFARSEPSADFTSKYYEAIAHDADSMKMHAEISKLLAVDGWRSPVN
jgi:hypothetical protein